MLLLHKTITLRLQLTVASERCVSFPDLQCSRDWPRWPRRAFRCTKLVLLAPPLLACGACVLPPWPPYSFSAAIHHYRLLLLHRPFRHEETIYLRYRLVELLCPFQDSMLLVFRLCNRPSPAIRHSLHACAILVHCSLTWIGTSTDIACKIGDVQP